MKHQVRHELEPESAKELIESLVETYKQHYSEIPVSSSWATQDRMVFDVKVRGRRVEGEIVVCVDSYDFAVDLPWALRPFKGRITSLLDREVARWAASRTSS